MKIIVNIDVPELTAAIAFYTAALGLNLNRMIDTDVAEISGASVLIYLLANDACSPATKYSVATRNYSRHWTPVHIDFVVDDILQASQQAIAAGATCENDLVEWRGSKCMTFADPFGHGFCLLEFTQYGDQDN